MFNMRIAVKTALAKRDRTMLELADTLGKDRPALTTSLYNGNPTLRTIKMVADELGFKLSEFFALGED